MNQEATIERHIGSNVVRCLLHSPFKLYISTKTYGVMYCRRTRFARNVQRCLSTSVLVFDRMLWLTCCEDGVIIIVILKRKNANHSEMTEGNRWGEQHNFR